MYILFFYLTIKTDYCNFKHFEFYNLLRWKSWKYANIFSSYW